MSKLSKKEKVNICDLSNSAQPKITMHKLQESFRARFPPYPEHPHILLKSAGAGLMPVLTVCTNFPYRGNRGKLLTVPHRSLSGLLLHLARQKPPSQLTARACLMPKKQALKRLRMWIAGTRRTAPSGLYSLCAHLHEPAVFVNPTNW